MIRYPEQAAHSIFMHPSPPSLKCHGQVELLESTSLHIGLYLVATVALSGEGKFSVTDRAARMDRNPRIGEE